MIKTNDFAGEQLPIARLVPGFPVHCQGYLPICGTFHVAGAAPGLDVSHDEVRCPKCVTFHVARCPHGMPKARDYHLNEQELAALEGAIRHDKRPEVRQRCTAIRLLHLGHKPKQVAHMQAVSIPTIYGWYNRWQQDGIEGLATKPRSGRPAKTGQVYRQTLEEALEKDPQEFGYDFSVWTIERLRLHLVKATGTELSAGRLRILLQRHGYRYRRPKHDLGHLQDKDAKAQAAELLAELKKRPSPTISSSSLWTKRR